MPEGHNYTATSDDDDDHGIGNSLRGWFVACTCKWDNRLFLSAGTVTNNKLLLLYYGRWSWSHFLATRIVPRRPQGNVRFLATNLRRRQDYMHMYHIVGCLHICSSNCSSNDSGMEDTDFFFFPLWRFVTKYRVRPTVHASLTHYRFAWWSIEVPV